MGFALASFPHGCAHYPKQENNPETSIDSALLQYRKHIEKLENDHLLGSDPWPKDLNSAYNLLNNWNGGA
jgi:hypothetical protein